MDIKDLKAMLEPYPPETEVMIWDPDGLCYATVTGLVSVPAENRIILQCDED